MHNLLKRWLLTIFILVSSQGLADASVDYRSGIEAFKTGNYEEALTYFKQAEAAGMDIPRLYYNLGATNYKLGRYGESRTYFSRLVGDPKWGTLAEYNLGLIAEVSGDQQAAIRYYSQVYRTADPTSKVKQLAGIKLTELKPDA